MTQAIRFRDPTAPRPTIPAHFVRIAVEGARARGIDPGSVLWEAGIPASLLAHAGARCTPEQVAIVIRRMWSLTGDELFGLGAAAVPRGSFALLSHGLVSAHDLAEVLARGRVFAPALPGLPSARAAVTGGDLTLTLAMPDVGPLTSLMEDLALVVVHRFGAWLVGDRIPLASVTVAHAAPSWGGEYDHVFGCPVAFGSAVTSLTMPAAVLAMPVVRDESALAAWLADAPLELLAHRDYGSTAADRVRAVLAARPVREWPDAVGVAAVLACSPAHLRRLLQAEGTTLSRIRDELLRDLAVARLARGDTVEAISAALGFSEPSAFRRAFRRWTGSSPTAYQLSAVRA